MFGMGWSEMVLIGIVALIVIGPKDLPKMFRALGEFTGKARGMAREFSRAMEAAAEAEPEAADAPVILTASVDGGNGANIVRARYNSGSKILLMDAVSLKTAPLYPEIWIVPADGKARSLGMIKTSGQTQLKINSEMQQYIYDGADIVITPEPQGGAPGGVATGPAIALGKLSKA